MSAVVVRFKLIGYFSLIITIITMMVTILSGCAGVQKSAFMVDRDTNYLSAQSIPPLRIPYGISSRKFHNEYPVTSRTWSLGSEPVSVVPPDLYEDNDHRDLEHKKFLHH